MKTLSTILLLICIPNIILAQSRENRNKISFTKESEKVKLAIGWSYNATLGEWIDYENVICNDKNYKTEYKSLQGGHMKSRFKQNFESILFKKTSLDSIPYYVLIIEKWGGGYEYPTIKKGWKKWKEIIGYVYNEDEYKKLTTLGDKIVLKTKNIVSLGINKSYNEQLLLDKIQTDLGKEKNKYSPEYQFPIIKTESEGQTVIRFYLPNYFSKFDKFDFEKKYFEIETLTLKKLIIN